MDHSASLDYPPARTLPQTERSALTRATNPLSAHRAFRQFWVARIASGFGFQMMSVAVGWQVYDITRSAFDLGLIGLVQFIPSVLLALPAGHIADRVDRRRIVVVCQALESLAIAALAFETLLGQPNEATILALVLVVGIGRALRFPASQALVPGLVPLAVLPQAMAANSGAMQVAMIVGPAVGGFLYVAGPGVVYTVATLLYLVAIAFMLRLRYEHALPEREPVSLTTVFAGVRFIRDRPVILGVISLDLFAVLLGGATALLPIFARDILHTGPWGLGLLRAAPAVGALAMSIPLARSTFTRRVGHVMFFAVAGFGLATLVFAVSRTLWLSLVALGVLGAFDMVSMVIRGALVQLETPDTMRGRVSAVNAIFISTSNQLGEFESGLLASWIGAVGAAVAGGVGTLMVVALWMALFPALRRRERLAADPAVAAAGEPM